MAETYVKKMSDVSCSVLCEDCYKRHYIEDRHLFSKSDVDEIADLVIAYVEKGNGCADCNAPLNPPLHIHCGSEGTLPPEYSPSTEADPEPEELTIPPIDFVNDSDEAIARWLLLQPKHEFNVPMWQVCALIDSIYWVLYALDHPDESWDVEADKNRLKSFQNKTLMFLWDNNQQIRTLHLSHQQKLPSIYEKVKEILNDESTERN